MRAQGLRRGLLTVLVLCAVAVPSWTLELTEGRLKLVLHEELGRFSLEYRPELDSERYVSLLDTTDPRTSDVRIRDRNDVYRLGSAPRFEMSLERSAGSAAFVWESGALRIRQSFSFVTSSGARLANGVLIELSIENRSEVTREVGVRYLFDTHLAETEQTHFVTETGERIRSETSMTPSPEVTWWASPDAERDEVGFQQLVAGDGISRPERVVFANWKRLSESAYDFTVSTERTFSLLPYSIDDSAAAVYYAAEQLEPGATRTITTLVGNLDPDGYEEYSVARTESAELLERTADTEDEEAGLDRETARQELVSVDDLLDEIDTILSEEEEYDEEDVEVVEEILKQLRNRKEAYDTQ